MSENGKQSLKSYKDLQVWQKAYELTLLIYRETTHFPKEELYGLTAQCRRCSLSVPSNIAEGYNRQSRKEYLQFLSIAFGSIGELETQMLLAKDLGLLKPDRFQVVNEKIWEVSRMLLALISSLKNSSTKYLLRRVALSALVLIPLYPYTLIPSWAAGPGTSGGQFLRVGVGARALGMGGAFSALANDASAIYWNPAGLASLEQKEVTLSYNAYFADTSAQFLGYAHPNAMGGVCGASVNMLSVSSIEKRSATAGDADTADGGTFKTSDLAGTAAYARKLNDNLSLGGGLKFISSDLGDNSATAFALDLGALYKINDNIQASLALLNLGSELKFIDEGDPLPMNLKPGVAWMGEVGDYGKLNAVLDADVLLNDSLVYVNPGVEYWPMEMLAIRGGYQIGRDSHSGGLGAGLGFRYSNLAVDYAFVPFGDLGDTHRVSLGLRF